MKKENLFYISFNYKASWSLNNCRFRVMSILPMSVKNILKCNFEFLQSLQCLNGNTFSDRYILFPAFLMLGFDNSLLYLPLFVLYYLLKFSSPVTINIQKDYAIFSVLIVLFVFSLFAIGAERMTIDMPWRSFFMILFSLVAAGFTLHYQSYNTKLWLLGLYIIGILFYCLSIVIYSVMADPLSYGYGKLLSPFSGEELNSPAINNLLSICFAFFYYIMLYRKSRALQLFSMIVVLLSIMAGIFLGGRTFFIIAALTILFFIVARFNIQAMFRTGIFIALLVIAVLVAFQTYKPFSHYYEFLQFRILEGYATLGVRFVLYKQGLEKLPLYPLGGFHIEDNIWTHNLWLDTAMVAGWLPLCFLFLALLYMLKPFMSKQKALDFAFLFFIYLATLLIMAQDVIIEGNYRVFIVFYLSAVVMLTSSNRVARPC